MYGHAPGIYGETEILLGTDQYPTGMLNPFDFGLPEARWRERLPGLKGGTVDSPDVRESCGSDRDKVLLCDPIFPVLYKHLQCGLGVLPLAEREFVNDRVVVRHNENARRYPRLSSAHPSERLVKDD
jgi:hypothetical protein